MPGVRHAACCVAVLAASATTHGQQVPAAAQTVEAVVPTGWEIEQRHAADFNRDGRTDALVLLRRPGQGDVPSRMLLVAFARPSGGFALAESNARIIPIDTSGQIEDPMADGELVVRPAGFDLTMGFLPAIGSYRQATFRYRFRFDGRCFRLVGYQKLETDRATLDTTDTTVSLLTGRVTTTTGNAETGGAKTANTQSQANRRRCLSDVGNGWTFDPLASR